MLATPPNMSLMPFRGFERNRCGPRPLLVHRLPQHPLGDTPAEPRPLALGILRCAREPGGGAIGCDPLARLRLCAGGRRVLLQRSREIERFDGPCARRWTVDEHDRRRNASVGCETHIQLFLVDAHAVSTGRIVTIESGQSERGSEGDICRRGPDGHGSVLSPLSAVLKTSRVKSGGSAAVWTYNQLRHGFLPCESASAVAT